MKKIDEEWEKQSIELLAGLEHEQWAHWTKYMLEKLGYHENDSNDDVRRWFQQIKTPYSELSEKEKDSDRAWAKKVMNLLFGG